MIRVFICFIINQNFHLSFVCVYCLSVALVVFSSWEATGFFNGAKRNTFRNLEAHSFYFPAFGIIVFSRSSAVTLVFLVVCSSVFNLRSLRCFFMQNICIFYD
ncbi:hypothetical protein EDEG_03301 [Edhazardia aedis USNM 41457]|uniref:Uncharacterized protein n=1 Tax=Edhazardia aedis (strain USNM 41457) TaxID=1003232 RepID=J8ZRD4_EDHAE|nr:hypothetical protein EDEG_03301 [Edhazardia aedis USNM 41457]|eukprot:EJW02258.1 hypothetical protein EDEG_03301 [Edhazardia aedis USNM 41457]